MVLKIRVTYQAGPQARNQNLGLGKRSKTWPKTEVGVRVEIGLRARGRVGIRH